MLFGEIELCSGTPDRSDLVCKKKLYNLAFILTLPLIECRMRLGASPLITCP